MAEHEFQDGMSAMIIDILGTLGVGDPKVEVVVGKIGGRDVTTFSITVDKRDSKMLIGQHGVSLFSLQHLLQMIARRKFDGVSDFSVDVNRYWKEKRALLRRDAEEAAHDAVSTGRPVPMRPMFSYERKIVHAVLAENDRVETGSIGRGEERKVVVKPKAVFLL
ncbi:MAG: R3H domain-containing nucleic acid-binding protein [Candidatus Moraniibacteriota bacterium]